MRLPYQLRRTLFLIKKNRFQRKLDMHKRAFQMMIDKTIAIYLLVLVGYLVASMFIFGDILQDNYDLFITVEMNAKANFWLLVTAIPIRNIIQSFTSPGVLFSSSEHRLAMLPFSRAHIWLLCAMEKWVKEFLILMAIGLLVVVVTPISAGIVLLYILILTSLNILMTIPQWALYQENVYTKIGLLGLMFFFNAMIFLLNLPWLALVFILLIALLNIVLNQTLFNNVNWGHVTEVSDFLIWNMLIISKVSKVNMKRQRRYSLFQRVNRFKKPFRYTDQAIYPRLLHIYFLKNIKPFLQLVGALLLLLMVFLFIGKVIFTIILAVAIHIYTTVLATFFRGHFETDIIQIIPWKLSAYKRSFTHWALYGGVVLMIPVLLYGVMYPSIWYPLQLIFYVLVSLFTYDFKLEKAVDSVGKQWRQYTFEELLSFFLFISICLTSIYEIASLSSLFIIGWHVYKRKRFTLAKD